ncbi:MAG TPA: fused MFS/spermidine synthase [Verrucomicrobiae bacterium]|jgi:spermidine synthase|nr:fused MFS/spermidine synthase [Verrucomicrobiae bacterium]
MLRLLLDVIVFVSGAVLMALEIVGSRVLAPYFGNSIFVWGSLISVVLAALSAGYYWGGRLSENHPSFARLLLLLIIPGAMIFILPFFYPSVNLWIAENDFGPRLNPLIAGAIFFLIPGIFLGAISPYAIRLGATALSTVGSTAGTLYALSTCGSIFGTLFTAFYLIPVLGVGNIIHALGITLVLLAAVMWPLTRDLKARRAGAAKAAAVFVAALALTFPQEGWSIYKTLLEKDSFYHHIRVQQDDEARYLYFDQTLQSAMNLDDPTALRLVYSRYVSLGFTFRPDAKKALVVGLGGGSVPKKWQKEFPSLDIDVAEIDPEVVEIAKKYFSFQEGKNLRAHAQDGRLFLTRTAQRYDVVLLDAYFKDSIPFHLTTKEFFTVASQKLNSNGVVVMNIIGAVTGPGGRITRSVAKTLRGIFPQVYIFGARRPENVSLDSIQNVIIVATKSAERVDIREIVKRAAGLNAGLFPKSLNDIAVAFVEGKIADDDVPVLTDDYAPTDKLLHP